MVLPYNENKFQLFRGQNEGGFSQEQLDMYKECFKLMDIDKDGTITKNDIRAAFDNVGKLMSEGELDDMLGEVGGACTFQAMIDMFQKKMAGGKCTLILRLLNRNRDCIITLLIV